MIRRLLAAVVLLWVGAFAYYAMSLPLPAGDERTDGIVVLTGSAGRIERGVGLLQEQRAKRMLISGVDPDTGRASLRRAYAIPARVMSCCIDVGHEAIDTRSNAIETSAWIRRRHYRSIRLITADWHMARASYELRRQLPAEVRILPDPVQTQPSLRILLREFHKYMLRRLAGLAGI